MADPTELPDEVKKFIVTSLATWETPSAVAAAVKADFGLEVTRQRVEVYDPTKVAGKALSEGLRALFAEARARYLADTAEIGIAHKTYRLRALERMLHLAESARNPGLVLQVLEQAAKESGGAFTNRRELTGADGKPIETVDKTPQPTGAQVLDELAAIFGAAAVGPAAARDGAKPARNAPRSDRVLRKGPKRGSAKKPRASEAR